MKKNREFVTSFHVKKEVFSD